MTEAQETRINRWLSKDLWQRNSVLQTLRIILSETLDNVAEHAYRERGFGGVCPCSTGQPEEPRAFSWIAARLGERKHCPTMGRNNFGKHPGWLEIFVCDVGRGLLPNYRLIKPATIIIEQSARRPLSRYKNRAQIREANNGVAAHRVRPAKWKRGRGAWRLYPGLYGW